jgi:hypothetical protein
MTKMGNQESMPLCTGMFQNSPSGKLTKDCKNIRFSFYKEKGDGISIL